MKIIILADNISGGGALLVSAVLNEAFDTPEITEIFGIFSEKIILPDHSHSKITKIKLPFLYSLFPKWLKRAVLVNSCGSDCVIFNFTNFSVGLLKFRSGLREFCLVHNAYFLSKPTVNMSFLFYLREVVLRSFIFSIFMFFTNKKNTQYVVQSNFMKNLFLSKYKFANVLVGSIHTPPSFAQLSKIRFQYNEKEISSYWLYPASGEPHKNHNLLIDICLKSIKDGGYPKIFITLDESARYGSEILKRIKDSNLSGNIVNISWLTADLKDYLLQNCFGVIFMSNFESLGIPLIESRKFRKRIICSKSEISKEILGNQIKLFDLDSADDIHEITMQISQRSHSYQYAPPLLYADRIIDSYFLNFL